MRLPILLGLVAFSVLLGVLNNVFNPDAVAWIGSPEVYPKPEGWPSLSVAQGMAAGARTAWEEVVKHPALVAFALALLAGAWGYARRAGKPAFRAVKSWWRLVFAAMFLAAAWGKFSDPAAFAELVAQYQLLPPFAVNLFSVLMPALEITLGLALLFLPWEKESGTLLAALMLMFIVALTQALYRGLGIACGCFDMKGATDAGETWFALLRDLVLLVPIFWLWKRAEDRPLWKL